MADIRLLYATAATEEDATIIANGLLENKLAACINILPNMTSFYEWEGKIEKNQEVVIIIKTTSQRECAAIEFIEKNHRYETPCVASIPVQNGSVKFLNWIASQVN